VSLKSFTLSESALSSEMIRMSRIEECRRPFAAMAEPEQKEYPQEEMTRQGMA
jgi:hypothetical protein